MARYSLNTIHIILITPIRRIHRIHRILHTTQAVTENTVPEIIVEFGSSQSIGALREAAYRLIAEASCLIDAKGDRYVCRLIPKKAPTDERAIRTRFLDIVTDENLREKVAAETAGVRDVIIALAFGALARERDRS